MLVQILVKWLNHKDVVPQAFGQRNQAIKLGENIKVDYYFSSRSKSINIYWIFKNNIFPTFKSEYVHYWTQKIPLSKGHKKALSILQFYLNF